MAGNNNNVPEPVSALDFSAHTADSSKVLAALNVDPKTGLSEEEAAKRLALYGPNRIKPPPKANIWKIIGRQVANAMTAILSGCCTDTCGTTTDSAQSAPWPCPSASWTGSRAA